MIIATLTPLGDDVLEPIGVDGQLVTNLYERVRPAVVHITTWVITVDFFFGPMPYEGIDSGFVSDKEGHIVTDYHVIKGADTVQVEFSDRLEVPAHVIGIDPPND